MKLIIALFLTVSSSAVFAKSLCGDIVVCGKFAAVKSPGNGIAFTDLGNMNLSWVAENADGSSSTQILQLRDDGSFVIDHDRAVGVCENQVCHLSVRPLVHNGQYYGQFITLKFSADSVEMDKVNVWADGTVSSTKALYNKM